MIEVESKYRIPDDKIVSIVSSIEGVCRLKTQSQSDLIYLYNASSFATFIPGDPVVRIRDTDGRIIWTVKRKRPEGDMWEVEVPLGVSSVCDAADMMNCLGWTLVTRVDKRRRSGSADGLTIAVDDVAGLGMFIEIEALVDFDEDVVDARSKIDKLRSTLGIRSEWREERKYDELINLEG